MSAKKIILAALTISSSLSLRAEGAAGLAGHLLSLPSYNADATFEVYLPQASDPVSYRINLQSASPAQVDTLSPCNYLITWRADDTAHPSEGFSAYYDGNHYRYRNNRLQEYHAVSDPSPFMPGGSAKTGVQSKAQFADLLPGYLGCKIKEMLSDSSYIMVYHPDTLVSGKHTVVIDGVKRGNGFDVAEYTYIFDKDTLQPLRIEKINSPGSISEQAITVTYRSAEEPTAEISEETLMAMWPEVFEKLRENTFRTESLIGRELPSIKAKRLTDGVRYVHNSGEPFESTSLIVFVDPSVATAEETVSGLREAAAGAPANIDILWAFSGNSAEEISAVTGNTTSGETVLTSAGSLFRDCGITMYPTTIITGKDGKVKDVVCGYNKNMPTDVIQKALIIQD